MRFKTNNRIIGLAIVLAFFLSTNFVLSQVAESLNYSIESLSSGSLGATGQNGNLSVRVLTTSYQPSTRSSYSENYTVNLGSFFGTTYVRTVSISSYSILPQTSEIGSTISFAISAPNSQKVWVKIVSPNGQTQTLYLVNDEFVTYSPPSITGRYNVTFYANDTQSNTASAIDHFDITEKEIQGSSSSHSRVVTNNVTTVLLDKCSYVWDCTPWSLCTNGVKNRQCKNIGTCEGIENKPLEEMKCDEVLFDVSFSTKDLTFLDNTLHFKINLTKIIGEETLDVHTKYTIIKEGKEIFSQIETIGVGESIEVSKALDSLKLEDGDYILRVDILYGNLQRAFSEQSFTIKNNQLSFSNKSEKYEISLPLKILGGLILANLLILLIILTRKLIGSRGNEELDKINEELSVASRFLELGKLDESKESYNRLQKIYHTLSPKLKEKIYPKIEKIVSKINSLVNSSK